MAAKWSDWDGAGPELGARRQPEVARTARTKLGRGQWPGHAAGRHRGNRSEHHERTRGASMPGPSPPPA